MGLKDGGWGGLGLGLGRERSMVLCIGRVGIIGMISIYSHPHPERNLEKTHPLGQGSGGGGCVNKDLKCDW